MAPSTKVLKCLLKVLPPEEQKSLVEFTFFDSSRCQNNVTMPTRRLPEVKIELGLPVNQAAVITDQSTGFDLERLMKINTYREGVILLSTPSNRPATRGLRATAHQRDLYNAPQSVVRVAAAGQSGRQSAAPPRQRSRTIIGSASAGQPGNRRVQINAVCSLDAHKQHNEHRLEQKANLPKGAGLSIKLKKKKKAELPADASIKALSSQTVFAHHQGLSV